MIKSLHISNYALIDRIDIDFAAGFNIITGETGAGKSIILGALSLLLGGRADTKAIRDRESKSVIEAFFDVRGLDGLTALLKEADIDVDDSGECILRRELSPGGRSRAFVNDTPVNLNILRDVAVQLVDIHSQHQNLLIADPSYQLGVIDTLAGNKELVEQYRHAYRDYRVALKRYTDTRDQIRRNQSDEEYITFQYDQLCELDLVPGEQESLERERELLGNLGEIRDKLLAALDPLVYGQVNAVGTISEAVSACEALAFSLGTESDEEEEVGSQGGDFRSLAERLSSALIEVRDVAESLQRFDSGLQADPERLEEVESRISKIYSLELKHHVDSVEGLIALRDDLGRQLSDLANSEETLGALETKARQAKKHALSLATRLSESRSAKAAWLASELKLRASLLGMPNLRCEVSMNRVKLTPDGFDTVELLFAFNKNQQLTSIAGSASGGEISRLTLTLKSIVAECMGMPSIIFDEVDTGVSGDIANRMAEMMAAMGNSIQVICITHLPGVAARGSVHFKVFKQDDDRSTTTRIRRLERAERVAELALMLSGNPHDPAARANAESLLARSELTEKS